MILDHIQNAALYYQLNDRLAFALRALQGHTLHAAKPGRVELQGTDIVALPQRYDTKPRAQGRWEAHRQYIDIQYMVDGAEVMGCVALADLQVTEPYNAETDVLFLTGTGNFFTVNAGMFVIFFPHDAHMPQLAVTTPAPVRKIVVKVRAG